MGGSPHLAGQHYRTGPRDEGGTDGLAEGPGQDWEGPPGLHKCCALQHKRGREQYRYQQVLTVMCVTICCQLWLQVWFERVYYKNVSSAEVFCA